MADYFTCSFVLFENDVAVIKKKAAELTSSDSAALRVILAEWARLTGQPIPQPVDAKTALQSQAEPKTSQ